MIVPHRSRTFRTVIRSTLAALVVLAAATGVGAFEIQVMDAAGNPVSGFRYLVEEDTTVFTTPGATVSDSIGVNIHRSHAPVVTSGAAVGSTATVGLPDTTRYFVTVLPDSAGTFGGHTVGGAPVPVGATTVRVVVNALPLPTAQFSVYVFVDHNTINNAPDMGIEEGLEGFKIILEDAAGQIIQDAFGNPIGTEYARNPDGTFQFDVDGMPIPTTIGIGYLFSGADGWAHMKYLAPGKYGAIVIPPVTDEFGAPVSWIQTSTIEGTKLIDVWVQANEPPLWVEGFGTATAHAAFGFVNPDALPWAVASPGGTGTITGRLVNNHFARPPSLQGFHPGEPIPDCWVGLNDVGAQQGLVAVPCDGDSYFLIPNVPPGTYELVSWDEPLDQLFGFATVTVAEGGGLMDLGNVLSNRWFGRLEGRVFNDLDEDGFPDPGEAGLAEQAVLLRYRDGRVYQAAVSEPDGSYELTEVFPFFKWLVAEVDFASRKATGATFAVDGGGAVPLDNGWIVPSRGRLTPQEQPATNPNTGNNLSRTETGEVLTQGIMIFLGETNVIDWGKAHYDEGENGGISGIVFYAITRAENDPRWAVGEEWEPGIPRVQVNLYADANADGLIDDLDTNAGPTLADVDNHPLGWADGGVRGDEDVDHNGDGLFDPGDAINITWTDSWDDAPPTGCIQELPFIHGQYVRECYDNFGTWNQLRPGVFDGGYAFTSYFAGGMASPGAIEVDGLPTGTYIVEATAPPGYEHQQEEDKNVDYGDVYEPSVRTADVPPGPGDEAIPVPCIGDLRTVPAYLSLFPDRMDPAPYAGTQRPGCDRKQVALVTGLNAAAEFFMLTEVPKAARGVGFVNNDLAAEFNTNTPNFGEKAAPSWLPVSIQDWAGNEISRIYTDEFGAYTFLVPSTYTVNLPSPTGVSPNMLTVCLNHPLMPDPNNPGQLILDPFYDPDFSQSCWPREYTPGANTYLDTPIVPVGAFAGYPNRNLDLEAADGSPGIGSVDGDLPGGGPVVCAADATITIHSRGIIPVPNPDFDPDNPFSSAVINRNYGFGAFAGRVTLGGVDLPITGWSDSTITATVPGGTATGQLLVLSGQTGLWSETGITVHVGECSATFVPADFGTIQAAIDAAAPGELIIVSSGTYIENPIMWKPVRLQGAAPHSTIIFANPSPASLLDVWHAKAEALYGSDPFAAMEAPGILVFAGIGATFGGGVPALIDGFSITGSLAGGGIYVYEAAHDLEVSNNTLRSNQGNTGGGLTVGAQGQALSNVGVNIHHNRIVKNGGVLGGGGVSVYTGATGYVLADNVIAGNLSRFGGAGVLHYGVSDGGLIARNRITYNEVFWGGQIGGDGGGVFIGGATALQVPDDVGDGAGTVTIDRNFIHGNLAGSGDGGGIRVDKFNGGDIELPPASWFRLSIVNNIITNNVAAMAGAGVSLFNVADVVIAHNTIAHNDTTATAATAFTPGNTVTSNPQPAGVVSYPHSLQLQGIFPAGMEQAFSDPLLANNIVWHNRSYYWDATFNSGKGGLAPAATPIQDFAVVSTVPTHALTPLSSIISDTTGQDPSNLSLDPLFQGQTSNTIVTAAVIDEGGNFITVRFTPLVAPDAAYRVATGTPASGVADPTIVGLLPELGMDFDGQPRLQMGAIEAGADELLDGDANCDGVFDSSDVLQILTVIYGGTSLCGQEDINNDGVVDSADLALAAVIGGW